jgi:hypothetical protein
LYTTIASPRRVRDQLGPSRIPGARARLVARTGLIFAAITPLVVAGDDPARAIALAGMMALLVALIEIGLGVAKLGFVADLSRRRAGRLHENGLALRSSSASCPSSAGSRPMRTAS